MWWSIPLPAPSIARSASSTASARGLVLVVIAYLFYGWLIPVDRQEEWVKNARSLPVIQSVGEVILSLVPPDIAETLTNSSILTNQPPAQQPPPPQAGSSDTQATPNDAEGYKKNESQGLDQLIQGTQGTQDNQNNQTTPPPDTPEQPDFGGQTNPELRTEAMTAPYSQFDFDLDGDTLREECGVFGIFGHDDAAALTALGLHALQHRGQEAAGIVAFNGERFHSERRLGLVGDHFSNENTIKRLQGRVALGHVRYSTTGETILRNVQPLFAELATGGLAVAHNGNLTNGLTLRRELVAQGAICQSTSDTEVILHLVARSQKPRIVERYIDALRALEGAYSLVAMTNKKLIGARDPLGIRPADPGRVQRRLYPLLGNLRARHHRRALRARNRERRSRRDFRGRGRVAQTLPAHAGTTLHLRICLFLPARQHTRRALGL